MSKENDGTGELPEKKQVVPKKRKIQIIERWFGDDPPHWDGAPTALAAWKDREAAVKRLCRHPFPIWFPGAQELSEKLSTCVPNRRCGSGACPECMRAVQRVLTAHIAKRARGLT
jgi:hypothetical protein